MTILKLWGIPAVLVLAPFLLARPQDVVTDETLSQIKHNVAEQISETSNYGCVETIERTYFRSTKPTFAACGALPSPADEKEFAEDRLRMDLAVSKGAEIYSWHGQNHYSSATISDIVQNGPISSGGFIGYLRNIFMGEGIEFKYTGRSTVENIDTYNFDFKVARPYSQYAVHTRKGMATVPFHGSFSASVANLQLITLRVIPDEIPFNSEICGVQTDIVYQLARISGRDALIPKAFTLRMDDENHLYTVSRAQYSQCHEFLAVSTLRFDTSDVDGTSAVTPEPPPTGEPLPAGLEISVALTTPVDGEKSFTGDPVEGIVLEPVIQNGKTLIPKGGVLHGVLTQLQNYVDPDKVHYTKIQFDGATFNNRTVRLRAYHVTTIKELQKLTSLFGGVIPGSLREQIQSGVMVSPEKRLHLDRGFKGVWRTVAVPSETAEPANQ